MDLFENLQIYREAKPVKEAQLSKSIPTLIYNQMKQAANKSNDCKDKFIFTLEVPRVHDNKYGILIRVHATLREKINPDDKYTTSADAAKWDPCVYTLNVNLIDETIDIGDKYEHYSLNSIMGKLETFGIDENKFNSLIEASENNLINLLKSKNFIYRLSGAKGPHDNYTIEKVNLTEDFDKSMPSWLAKSIKLSNAMFRNYRTGDNNDFRYNLPLDTLKWSEEPFPTKGKIPYDDKIVAFLVDKSGDAHTGNYTVFCPKLGIGSYETIEINNQNRKIVNMSIKALAPYISKYAVADKSAEDIVNDKQKARQDAKDGSIERQEYDEYNSDRIDKSGYPKDPTKYTRKLAQLHADKYATRVEETYKTLSSLRLKIKGYISADDFIPDANSEIGKHMYRSMSDRIFSQLFLSYQAAVENYNRALDDIDGIKVAGKTNEWSHGFSFEEFEEHMKKCQTYIGEAEKILNK